MKFPSRKNKKKLARNFTTTHPATSPPPRGTKLPLSRFQNRPVNAAKITPQNRPLSFCIVISLTNRKSEKKLQFFWNFLKKVDPREHAEITCLKPPRYPLRWPKKIFRISFFRKIRPEFSYEHPEVNKPAFRCV